MDVAPPALDAARAVLPNNILVLSGDTGNSSISDFVEEVSCQPPDLPALPAQPHTPTRPQAQPVCGCAQQRSGGCGLTPRLPGAPTPDTYQAGRGAASSPGWLLGVSG